MSTIIILLKSTRVFHSRLINEGIFNITCRLFFKNNRFLFSYCFLDRGEQSHRMGRFPHSPAMENLVHFTCIFENACQTSVVMSHKCNCMAFVIDRCSVFNNRLQVIDFPERVENIGIFGSFIQHTNFSFQSD